MSAREFHSPWSRSPRNSRQTVARRRLTFHALLQGSGHLVQSRRGSPSLPALVFPHNNKSRRAGGSRQSRLKFSPSCSCPLSCRAASRFLSFRTFSTALRRPARICSATPPWSPRFCSPLPKTSWFNLKVATFESLFGVHSWQVLSTGEGLKSSPTLSGSREGVLLILDVWGLCHWEG